ncbi:MAG: DNA repair protein RadC [Spirochaetia bacterium]|nr:DNA repair protein RadC [Spirochaetia bacterium]
MNSVYESPERENDARPDVRERLALSGPGAVSDLELLMAVIGSGGRGRNVRALAREALELVDGSTTPPEPERLSALRGVGEALACRISAALELGRRLYGHRERRVAGPRDVWPLVAHWADRKQERFIRVSLNGAHEVISVRIVSVGLVNRAIVHPREVFADAVAERACALIVAHNHPSGRLEPSGEDLEITRRLKAAGETIGIPLLDHLVFSADGYFSFVEGGLLEPGFES